MAFGQTMAPPPRESPHQLQHQLQHQSQDPAEIPREPHTALDSLLQRARAINPQLRAARSRVTAAQRRVGPAGLRPDPMLMAGVQNLPLREPGFSDVMTMKMVGISQMFPARGKLGLQQRIADEEARGTATTLVDLTRQVEVDVRAAYYELLFLDQALAIVQRNQDLLGGLSRITETRYRAGTSPQADVLKTQVEITRLAESAVTLTTQRRATLARLNALLDRPSDAVIDHLAFPASVLRAAASDTTHDVQFVSPALGALAAGSPFPVLDSLQALALVHNAALNAHTTMIAAQATRVALARKAAAPDINVSVQYGQRQAQPDMMTAVVSLPLPLYKHRNQDATTAATAAELTALDAEHIAMQNELRATVAQWYTTAERARTQLALYTRAMLPQERAALASARTSYEVGRVDLLAVLDQQVMLFTTETDYYRMLTDFATAVAQLERLVGQEMLQ
jgi:outer membrane protein TolC